MSGKPGTARKRGEIGKEDLKRLLARLDPDPERAWQAYGELRLALSTYFQHNHCLDPETLADETLDRIARKPDVSEIANIAEFAFGVARNVRREAVRRTAQRTDLADLVLREGKSKEPSPEDTIVSKIEMTRRLAFLRRCLAKLTAEERQLFLQYHPDECEALDEHRQRLADAMGVTWTSLRMRVSRIRRKLEKCFQDCCERSAGKHLRGGGA
jgi:DNA-directed RNA polymerase specialized sigma24 family protein